MKHKSVSHSRKLKCKPSLVLKAFLVYLNASSNEHATSNPPIFVATGEQGI